MFTFAPKWQHLDFCQQWGGVDGGHQHRRRQNLVFHHVLRRRHEGRGGSLQRQHLGRSVKLIDIFFRCCFVFLLTTPSEMWNVKVLFGRLHVSGPDACNLVSLLPPWLLKKISLKALPNGGRILDFCSENTITITRITNAHRNLKSNKHYFIFFF